jgi:NAD(P)H-hydrate repair Nnr-like enzyme with NAD(P)H-hydrate epimerase domain
VSPLPDWLEGLPDAERMRATDRWAIETHGILGVELMERAGAGLAALVA